jgi:prepilin-type N-terminal cleavage/methylation domain-containing protein
MLRVSTRRNRGFTLVELMIVVVIIGILAAMAIPRFNVSAYKAKEKEAEMFLAQIYRLQEAYRSNTGESATTVAHLTTVGFKTPDLRFYTWSGDVAIPQCIMSTGNWHNRRITADGEFEDC